MIDFKLFGGFGDRQTERQTFVHLESFSQLKKKVKRVTSSLKVGWVGAQNIISDRKEIVRKT